MKTLWPIKSKVTAILNEFYMIFTPNTCNHVTAALPSEHNDRNVRNNSVPFPQRKLSFLRMAMLLMPRSVWRLNRKQTTWVSTEWECKKGRRCHPETARRLWAHSTVSYNTSHDVNGQVLTCSLFMRHSYATTMQQCCYYHHTSITTSAKTDTVQLLQQTSSYKRIGFFLKRE